MSTFLSIYTTSELLTLPQAVQHYQTILAPPHSLAYALLYDPQRCCFAQLEATGTLRDAQGEEVATTTVFEAYLFNATAELRWLHVRVGGGQVAVLSENDALGLFGGSPCREKMVGCIPQSYLLWGEGTTASFSPGWSQLAEARIGAFAVPIRQVGEHGRVQLTAIEYLKAYCYGNVSVCEERLTGVVVADKEHTNG